MTSNETKLINLIRENENPEQALITATLVVIGFLKRLESSEEQAVVEIRERV
jgi:hypothetical protein